MYWIYGINGSFQERQNYDTTPKKQLEGVQNSRSSLSTYFNTLIFSGSLGQKCCPNIAKKGDDSFPYWFISYLSYVYKQFTRVITNRLMCRLEKIQIPIHARFRRLQRSQITFKTHTVRYIIKKIEKQNQPQDFEKANLCLELIETLLILEFLQCYT